MHRRLLAIFPTCLVATLGFACTSGKVLRIRSLGTTTDPQHRLQSRGDFDGIKPLLTAGTFNINIVEIHGMGWTQQDKTPEFGSDLVAAVHEAYP